MLAAISAPIGASIVTAALVALVAVLRYVLGLQTERMTTVKHDHVDDAKDELIDTLQANHEALSERVELLEKKAEGLDRQLDEAYKIADSLREKLADTLAKYSELQKYTAPEAVKALVAMVDAFAHTTNALLVDVLERLTAVEARHDSGLESVTQALDSLRRSVAADETRQ